MNKLGKVIYWIGVSLVLIMGAMVSYDPGAICNLDSKNLPQTIWSYPALCFTFWAFSVPIGLIITAIGILVYANAEKNTVLKTLIMFLFSEQQP